MGLGLRALGDALETFWVWGLGDALVRLIGFRLGTAPIQQQSRIGPLLRALYIWALNITQLLLRWGSIKGLGLRVWV